MISTVDKYMQRRVALNESAFREVNEAIERGLWQGEDGARVAFRCECSSLSCSELVEITRSEYEHIRADPRRFLILEGHDLPEAEVIVERHPRYVVVEKRAVAGTVAEANDPRKR